MVDRIEDYNSVFKTRNTQVILSDSNVRDGDRVNVYLENNRGKRLIRENLTLTKEGVPVDFTIGVGENKLTIAALNVGTVDSGNTVTARFREGDVIIGDTEFSGVLQPNQVIGRTIGLPRVEIDGTKSPYSAFHINESGTPSILTIKREGSVSRRGKNVRQYREFNGIAPGHFQIDEAPPASTADGADRTASTLAIPSSDNESGGSQFGKFIGNYGGVKLEDDYDIQYIATPADFESDNNIPLKNLPELSPIFGLVEEGELLVGSINENNLIYGTPGSDTIRGEGTGEPGSAQGGSDILLGGGGNDRIGGKGGNDQLLGQAGIDVLFGDQGDDILYGGPGLNALYGDDEGASFKGADIFALRKEDEGVDIIADFDNRDKIGLLSGLKYNDLYFVEFGGFRVDINQFPENITEIIRFEIGTDIRIRESDQLLAHVDGVGMSTLQDRSRYIEATGNTLVGLGWSPV